MLYLGEHHSLRCIPASEFMATQEAMHGKHAIAYAQQDGLEEDW